MCFRGAVFCIEIRGLLGAVTAFIAPFAAGAVGICRTRTAEDAILVLALLFGGTIVVRRTAFSRHDFAISGVRFAIISVFVFAFIPVPARRRGTVASIS